MTVMSMRKKRSEGAIMSAYTVLMDKYKGRILHSYH